MEKISESANLPSQDLPATRITQDSRPTAYSSLKTNIRMDLRKLLRFTKGNKKLLFGSILLSVIVSLAILAPLIAPYSYREMNTSLILLEKPSVMHWFGTDNFGRDVFSRVIYGARISLGIALLCVMLGTAAGVSLGMVGGYLGGWIDIVLMRLSDTLFAIPTVLMAITVTAILGPGLRVIIFALALIYIPGSMRLARGMVLSVREREYVAAAKVIGESKIRILSQYIFPNSVAPIIVQATLRLSSAVLSEAAISYLGYGTQPPTPSWGLMISDSQVYLWQAPYLAVFPGIAIVILVLAGNMFGDGLRDLLDPRFRGRVIG